MNLKSSVGFKILLIMFALNALITLFHFIAIFMGYISVRNSFDSILRIAIPDILIAAILTLIASFGIWNLKNWGIWLALIVTGAYFHGQTELLVMAYQQQMGMTMTIVSLYFILFSLGYVIYLWKCRFHFKS